MNEQALIDAMTKKGHTTDTARSAIAGRGLENLWGEYMGGSSGGTSGGSVPNLNFTPSPSPVGDISNQLNQLLGGYTQAIQNQTPAIDLMSQARDRYGIPQLNQAYFSGLEQFDALGNQIRGVPESVKQGSQESILTQGQLGRISESRQAPLLEQQGLLGQSLGRMGEMLAKAEQFAQTDVGLQQADQAKQLMPWAQAFSNAEILAGMQMTEWSTSNSWELQTLLSKFEAGVQMSENEKNRMHALSMQENEFANTMEQLRFSASQPISMGAGSSLINPQTGEVIMTAPRAGGSGGTQDPVLEFLKNRLNQNETTTQPSSDLGFSGVSNNFLNSAILSPLNIDDLW